MINLVRSLPVLVMMTVGGSFAVAEQERPEDGVVAGDVGGHIDAYLASIEPFGFSGAVLVEQDDRLILRKAYGMADRTQSIRNSTSTRFDLGSLAKQFTAALVMRLVERADLDLDTPLSNLLPDVPDDKKSITPRHLLSHSSGLPYHASIGHSVKGMTLEEIVPLYLEQPLQQEPGTRFSYSNPGYTLLAAIAERVGGRPFPDLLHELVLETAGLHATGHLARAETIGGPWARAYMDELDVGAPPEWPTDPEGYGAGGMASTLDDLHAWMIALRTGTVLDTSTVDDMWQKHTAIGASAGYGFGWFVATTPRETEVVFHAGDYQGFNNELRLYRDEGRLIIFLSNARLAGTGVREVALHNVATIAAGGDAVLAPSVIPFNPERTAPRMGDYVTPDGDRFTVAMTGDGIEITSTAASLMTWMSTAESPDDDERWRALVAGMMDEAVAGNFEPVHRARHRAVVVRGGPSTLETLMARLASTEPESITWEILGSQRGGPDGSGRTLVRIRTTSRTSLVQFAWMDDALLSISESSNASITLRQIAPDAFAWFDLFTGRSVRMQFEGESVRLDGGMSITAAPA